ncbi:hypothetical protein [Leuconostoc pseudomesenteroides]|uniref:hypothetical protein n=1 Tax=Leuconostoc pseudomesenteroides TaxID=33968 RepID=UPI0039E7DD52
MRLLEQTEYKGATIKLYLKTNVQYKATIKLPSENRAYTFYPDEHNLNGLSERKATIKQAKEYIDESLTDSEVIQ